MIPDVTCPECSAGKHRNCTVTVLVDDDTEVQCVCAAFDHDPPFDQALADAALDEAEQDRGAHTRRTGGAP